jgi:hypothetical protein
MQGLTLPPAAPVAYDGKPIRLRVPYTMPGELILTASAVNTPFPEGTFLHSTELPFEIWGMKLTASQSDAASPFVPVADPAPSINKFWRVRIEDRTKSQLMTKSAQLVSSLVESDETGLWQWSPRPYTIVRAEGFNVAVDNLLTTRALRAEVTFRGYLLVLEPPSEHR